MTRQEYARIRRREAAMDNLKLFAAAAVSVFAFVLMIAIYILR